MSVIKCKMCGGDLGVTEGTVAVCEYCGTKQTLPTADNEKKLTLFARANRLRMANEFDKAASVYESIVADFPEEAEAYWGLVLCRYGIEYVDDPATGRKVPTCHRSSFDSVMEDGDFEQACENADPMARRVYRDEAKTIEELRRGILEISGKEEPYDIFICYKEVDENGDRTIDSVIAQDVFDALTEKGYRVFFSRISLEDKLGTEYEPYIFSALHSAKVMLVFGTGYEYFNAVWVKNEWSRFLSLIAAGEKKTLIPCYKGIDAYDMPKEFARLQAQDMGKVGAIQDLLRGVEKILSPVAMPTLPISPADLFQAQARAQTQEQAENLVLLGLMALNSDDGEKGMQSFEEAIKLDRNSIGAYLGIVCASYMGKYGSPQQSLQGYCVQLDQFPREDVQAYLATHSEFISSAKLSLLEKSIRHGMSPEFIDVLLNCGANSNAKYLRHRDSCDETHTPLSDAVGERKSIELAEVLIAHGADVNFFIKSDGEASWSILDLAVRSNDLQMVRMLLEKGADPNSGRWFVRYFNRRDDVVLKVFYCVLSEAVWNTKNDEMIDLLLQYGADPNYQYTDYILINEHLGPLGSKKCSGVLDACTFGSASALKKLIAAGANPSETYEYTPMAPGETTPRSVVPILAVAACVGDQDKLEALINAGASFDELCYDAYGNGTPLKYCTCERFKEMKSSLQKFGWKGPTLLKRMSLDFKW